MTQRLVQKSDANWNFDEMDFLDSKKIDPGSQAFPNHGGSFWMMMYKRLLKKWRFLNQPINKWWFIRLPGLMGPGRKCLWPPIFEGLENTWSSICLRWLEQKSLNDGERWWYTLEKNKKSPTQQIQVHHSPLWFISTCFPRKHQIAAHCTTTPTFVSNITMGTRAWRMMFCSDFGSPTDFLDWESLTWFTSKW